MSSPLRFEALHVVRMPGFRQSGFELTELSPGINVIHGPNGSGKTTSARALEALLWPRASAALRPHLHGRFRLGSDEWMVEVEHDRTAHQRNGMVAEPPPLPPAEDRDRYRLSLHRLLASDASNARLAQAIMREAAGGYDLEAARSRLPSGSPLTSRAKEVKAVRDALAERDEAVARQRELHDQEGTLGELERKRAEAANAARRADLLRDAIAHGEARERHEAARGRVASFPAVMATMHGDEAERLSAAEASVREAEREIGTARARMAEGIARMEGADLDDPRVDAGFIAGLRADLDSVRELERKLADCERTHEAARAVHEQARRALGDAAVDDRLAAVTADGVGDLSQEAGRVETARQRVAALEARVRALGEDGSGTDREVDTIARAEDCLLAWLSAPAPIGAGGDRARAAALIAGGLLVLLGAALATVHVAAVLISVAGALAIWFGRARAPVAPDERERARSEFARSGLEPPGEWETDSVRRRLDQLQGTRAALHLDELKRNERDSRAAELEEARRALDAAEAAGRAVAERLGLAPDTDIVRLTWIVDRISKLADARSAASEARAELTRTSAQAEEARVSLRERLAGYDTAPLRTAGELAGAIQRLESRREERDAGSGQRDAAAAVLPGLEDRLGRCAETVRAIYEACGVDEGDAAALHERCRAFPAYRDARKELERAEVELRVAAGRVRAAGGSETVLEAAVGDLGREREEALRRAAGLQEISDDIVRIRDRIEGAKKLHDIEGALARLDRAKEALRIARERETRGAVAELLTASVRSATESEHLPGVFHRADELLSRITHGRYGLRFSSSPEPEFRAYDNQERQGLALDELSSGTRLQLLLAIRVAFVETQEREARLPLVLDEVLGNSDDARAGAIMDAVLELARDGRQIFYLTAQHDEVGKWKAALEAQHDVPWKLVEMPGRRAGQRPLRIDNLRMAPPAVPRVPSPNGGSHADYAARLDVPGIDPVDSHAGQLHLWYLIDDAARLHEVLRTGVATWGQLEAFARHTGDAVVDRSLLGRTSTLARAADAWLESIRIGAGRPTDRQALIDADCVSNAFLDRVDEKRQEVGGDARKLLAALEAGEVKGFRKDNIARLREHLEDGGWLDTREALPESEVRGRVLGRVGPEISDDVVTLDDVDRLIARLSAGAAAAAHGRADDASRDGA